MKSLVESTAFRKDRKRARKRGYAVAKLAAVIRKLQLAAAGIESGASIEGRVEGILGVPH
jgi:hypothetical protein